MKRNRRIEITAFRHRIMIAGDQQLSRPPDGVVVRDAETDESVDLHSTEGRQLLTEVIRILQNSLDGAKKGEKR